MIKVDLVYPITTRTEPNGRVYEFITDEDLKLYTTPVKLDSLYRFLEGKTRYTWGTYLGDVERWLNRLPNLD